MTLVAYLERAKIPIQIDIASGDIVAEKLEALVRLVIANTRMKDFYDLEVLSRTWRIQCS